MNLPGEIEDLGGLPEKLLAVVVIFLVGGLTPGVLAAVGSFLLANFFLTPPYHTLAVEGRDSIIALLVFLLVAVTVSLLVDVAAHQQAIAARSEADAESSSHGSRPSRWPTAQPKTSSPRSPQHSR